MLSRIEALPADTKQIDDQATESQDQKMILTLQQKVEELTQLVAARDKTIADLEARLNENKAELPLAGNENSAPCKTNHTAHTNLSEGYDRDQTNIRLSMDSLGSKQGTFNELFVKLSSELDSKLSEIDKVRLDHEARIEIIHDASNRSFETESFEGEEEQMECTCERASESKLQDSSILAKLEMISESLSTLKKEHQTLTSECHHEYKEFGTAFKQNCNKIMSYVREELDSECLPVKELRAYNDALHYELEVTRWENAELRAELQRIQDEGCDGISITPHKMVEHVVILSPLKSPLPTFESWAQFCTRFQEALSSTNDDVANQTKKTLVLDGNATLRADCLFKELSFAKDTTPFRRNHL